jgi:hypothetical protein
MHKKLMSLLIGKAFLMSAMPDSPAAGEAAKKSLGAGWLGLTVDVSKKVEIPGQPGKNEYDKVGEVVIPIPTLEAFGVTAKVKEVGEDGLPVYEDEKMDWLFGSVVAACKAQARNKLVSGTADLKEGLKIAETFEELTAEGERKGNAEALKLAKEIQKSFAAFVQGLGKSTQTQAVLVGLFRNKQALSLQTDETKNKMKGYLAQYAETLEEADMTRYLKHLTSVEEACAPGTPSDF